LSGHYRGKICNWSGHFDEVSHAMDGSVQRGAVGFGPDVASAIVFARLFTQRRWIDCCFVTAGTCRRG
jgi:hypothetical protein